MPILADYNKKDLDILHNSYLNLSGLKLWFFPHELGKILAYEDQTTINHAWLITNAYLNQTWFFQRYFFSCLAEFERTFLVKACKILKLIGLLNEENAQENFNVLASTEAIFKLFEGLDTLYKSGLLTPQTAPTYLALLENPKTQPRLLEQINRLYKWNLLKSPEGASHFLFLANHPNPELIDAVLNYIIAREFFWKEEIFKALVAQKDPEGMLHVFYFLERESLDWNRVANGSVDLDRQEIFNLVIFQKKPNDLLSALKFYSKHRPLQSESIKAIASSSDPKAKVAELIEKTASQVSPVPAPRMETALSSDSNAFFGKPSSSQVNIPLEDIPTDSSHNKKSLRWG